MKSASTRYVEVATSPDTEQLKAILATEIIKVLDRERLTVRQANVRTGIAAADFSRSETRLSTDLPSTVS